MKFRFDPRDLPDALKTADAQRTFLTAVEEQMSNSANGGSSSSAMFAAIVGMLVLDGHTDASSGSFNDGFWAIRGEAAGTTEQSDGTNVANKEIYQEAANKISRFTGHDGAVFYQELAQVSRLLVQNTDAVPFDSPSFYGQIRVYDDQYVKDGPQGATLDLPDLSGAGGVSAPDDLRPDNIRSVAVILAAYNLEQLRLFDSVDRITETWWNGQLPVGSDRGSQALDTYYWATEFRLTPTARHMQYGRVLGVTGGEVSTEVQPNTQFNDLWMRVVASLSEYDRQQRVADVVGGQRTNSLTLTGEQVRQACRNLAANASLYGWGGTQFAARRLATHIQTAFAILNNADIQNAYGVDGPWKVIERVAPEIGGTPNIVKYRMLADAGKKILDLIAKYSSIWSGSTGKPLFTDPAQSGVVGTLAAGFDSLTQLISKGEGNGNGNKDAALLNGAAGPPDPNAADIDPADEDEFMRQAGNVIAVMGIRDDTVSQFSEPSETQYAPSIPSLAAASGPTSTNGSAGIDQLRQMVTAGQTPSFDQLKSLVMPTGQ